jgi:cyclase
LFYATHFFKAKGGSMTMNIKSFRVGGILLMVGCILGCMTGTVRAQQAPPDYSKVQEQTSQIADGIYALKAVGMNMGTIGVLAGNDGVLLVDSQFAAMHQKVMDALTKISNQPVRFVINTHFHGDHTDGNALMGKAGAVIVAHETVWKRLSAGGTNPNSPPTPREALPVVTYSDNMTLHFNGEEIYLFHPVQSHSDGDTVVYFRHANVMHVGDLTFFEGFSPPNLPGGFSINGFVTAMEQIMKVANPDTKIITGHRGPVMTVKDLQQQHDMVVVIRDRVMGAIRAGKTVDEVVASKPIADFEETEKGGIPADQFVKAVYQDLSRKTQ